MKNLAKRAVDLLKGKKKSPEKIDSSEKEVIEPQEILGKWTYCLLFGIAIIGVAVIAGVLIFSFINPGVPLFAAVCT